VEGFSTGCLFISILFHGFLLSLMRVFMEDNEFIMAAQSLLWTYAKTMPDCPHE